VNAMKHSYHQHALRKSLLSPTIATFDDSAAPIFARNDPFYPYGFKIGYKDGESYWFDASSFRLVRHISVPFLNLTAQDDFLVSKPSRNKLGYCLANPNVMIVETRCGGHLGWQEAPPDTAFGASSWADTATADFFDAVMKSNTESFGVPVGDKTAKTMESVCLGETAVTSVAECFDQEMQQLKSGANEFTKKVLVSRL